MRLTKRTDHALRALTFLADRGPRGATAAEIAAAHGVSAGNMGKIVQALAAEGLVVTQRGRSRRSHLADGALERPVGAVVRALEPLDVVECFRVADDSCRLSSDCVLARHLASAREAFLRELDGITVGDLVTPTSRLVALSPPRRRSA